MKDLLLYVRFAIDYALKNKTLSHIKYLHQWYKDKQSGDTTLSRRLPWMTYDAIDFFSRNCDRWMHVFEWGSGGSTLYFASHCKEVVTIEHDPEWCGVLREKIKESGIKNVTLKEITGKRIDNFNEKDYRNPDDFVSKDAKSAGLSFEEYVKAIDAYPDEYFSMVLVDGRARNSCIKRAIPHIAIGGFLIVDNADREYYLDPIPELRDRSCWQKYEYQGPVFFQHAFSKTSVFRKLHFNSKRNPTASSPG